MHPSSIGMGTCSSKAHCDEVATFRLCGVIVREEAGRIRGLKRRVSREMDSEISIRPAYWSYVRSLKPEYSV